jgi:hypothetical protein
LGVSDRALTVGELIAALREFSEEKPVSASYDCGTAEGAIIRVEDDPFHSSGPGVSLVVE